MRSADALRRELAAAQHELDAAIDALAPRHKGGEWARYKAASARCYELERELTKALGSEYAVRIDWGQPWDKGAPVPEVVAAADVVWLLYLVADSGGAWDGTSVTVVDPAGGQPEDLAIVRFDPCVTHTFGVPDGDVHQGHRLHEKGLEPYSAHVVENSAWIAEQNAVPSPEYRHYVLLFHDEVFECIATGYRIDRFRGTFADARKLMRPDPP